MPSYPRQETNLAPLGPRQLLDAAHVIQDVTRDFD